MNVEKLLREIDWALGLGDELAEQQRPIGKRHTYGAPRVREGYFAKSADDEEADEPDVSPHAKTKAAHHEQLARLYQRVAGQHRSMADHYKDGAKGAHQDDTDRDFEQAAGVLNDPDVAAIAILKAAGHDVEARLAEAELQRRAVHSCLREPQVSDPSRAGFDKVRRSE